MHFNPRAPCGARLPLAMQIYNHYHFNPRAPCGARLYNVRPRRIGAKISTHAPLAGRDGNPVDGVIGMDKFQPTRPLRGATENEIPLYYWVKISTHAPLAGRDTAAATT